MTEQPGKAAGDEITVARLVPTLVVLAAGALVLGLVPLMGALTRIGYPGTALLLLGIVILSIGFFLAYERFTPSSPPTPHRDLAIILFAALLIGLWVSLFTNEVIAILVLGALGGIMLLPENWRQRLPDRVQRKGSGGR